MSEFEPQPEEQKRIMRLEFEGGEYLDLSPDNTLAFMHTNDTRYDHLFIHEQESDDDEEEAVRGYYYFRHEIPNFDNIVWHMRSNGFNIIDKDDVSDLDRKNFHNNHDTEAVVTVADTLPEATTVPLTPRQERLVAFARYILENGHLTPDEFTGSGDLYI